MPHTTEIRRFPPPPRIRARRPAPAARGGVRARRFLALAAALAAFCARGEQLWLSQSVSLPATEALRLSFSNTVYMEHGEHFANEEAAGFRHALAPGWSAGGGITFGQDRVERITEESGDGEKRRKRWVWSKRPSENLALDWCGTYGGWTVFDGQRFDLYFRRGERDWPLYRNIGSVTAPPVPGLPWNPRPYVTQQIYFTAREGYAGLDRFCQFRWGAGVRTAPLENLAVSVYWQYRDIEDKTGEWVSYRVAGVSAALAF